MKHYSSHTDTQFSGNSLTHVPKTPKIMFLQHLACSVMLGFFFLVVRGQWGGEGHVSPCCSMCYHQQRVGLHSTPKLLCSRSKQGSGWELATWSTEQMLPVHSEITAWEKFGDDMHWDDLGMSTSYSYKALCKWSSQFNWPSKCLPYSLWFTLIPLFWSYELAKI